MSRHHPGPRVPAAPARVQPGATPTSTPSITSTPEPTLSMPEPSQFRAILVGPDRVRLSWQQAAEGDLCISKESQVYGFVFLSGRCNWYEAGANAAEFGGASAPPEQRAVVGERYYLHQGGKFLAETTVEPWRVWMPLLTK